MGSTPSIGTIFLWAQSEFVRQGLNPHQAISDSLPIWKSAIRQIGNLRYVALYAGEFSVLIGAIEMDEGFGCSDSWKERTF